MDNLTTERRCPQCGSMKMQNWEEMSADDRFIVERLPALAGLHPEDRKKHRYCTRCWFKDVHPTNAIT